MNIGSEREKFAARLKSALRRARYSSDSPTALARNFNDIYPGRSVTVHAARKWLLAEAIPTQDKLRALASWLNVPADWLRFGTSEPPVSSSSQTHSSEVHSLLARMTRDEVTLVEDLHALDQDERHIVREMILLFFKEQEHAEARAVAGG